MASTEDKPTTIKVFREHSAWDTHSQWYALPYNLLRELYVDTWEIADGEPANKQQAAYVRGQYSFPVVLVY